MAHVSVAGLVSISYQDQLHDDFLRTLWSMVVLYADANDT